jgi:type II secretory pathway pseudopilin PulG
MGTNEIEQKIKDFLVKYDQLKSSTDKNVLSEIENAINSIKTALDDAKKQNKDESEITLASLSESVEEIEEYINSL